MERDDDSNESHREKVEYVRFAIADGNGDMQVRNVTPADLGLIRGLLAATWHDTYDTIYGVTRVSEITGRWHSIERLNARISKPGSRFILAMDGETCCGIAYASLNDENTVCVHQLYVDPHSQRRGIGTMLIGEIEKRFPAAARVRAEVEEANGKAIAFYERHDFRNIGRTSNCGSPDSGIPALVFVKNLI